MWWIQQPQYLGTGAVKALKNTDSILIPAIVFWEIALLIRKKRLALNNDRPVNEWSAEVLSIPRVVEVPLSHSIAIRADALEMHPDPADRFIVATALHNKAPLVTKDRLLLALPWIETIW